MMNILEADDFYASYYVNVIEDLKSLERYSNNYYQWYILALAQLRSGKPMDALESVGKVLEITQRYINRHGERTVKEVFKYQKKLNPTMCWAIMILMTRNLPRSI